MATRTPDVISPIGRLTADATKHAAKKPSHAHTSTGPCGCEVTVHWISKGCQMIKPDRCTEHAFKRTP